MDWSSFCNSIGHSFGSGDETAISLKVLVSNKLVGGATVNTIKETSGAKVEVVRIFSGVTNFQLMIC